MAALTVLFAGVAGAQTNFANPLLISGDYGSAVFDNTGVVPDPGTPTIANVAPNNTIWFQWSTTNSGEVVFDTMGSVYPDFQYQLDTVLGVYTGSDLASLGLLVANDDLYSYPRYTYSYQNYYTFADTNFSGTTNPPPQSSSTGYSNFQWEQTYSSSYYYSGPSQVRFNAVAGTTYYIAVDTVGMTGDVSLNWSLHPSGVFRFASEESDGMGATYDDGNTPMLLYKCAATEGQTPSTRADEPARFSLLNRQMNSSGNSYAYGGALVTITRVGGARGRVTVEYHTADIDTNSILLNTNGFLVNGDLPAVGPATNYTYYTNSFSGFTNIAPGDYTNITPGYTNVFTNISRITIGDYTPVIGTLTFDDYEMSKTIVVPIPYGQSSLLARPNRDFLVILTNAQVDAAESPAISPPRVDTIFSQALVRILDVNVDPKGYSLSQKDIVSPDPADPTGVTLITNSVPVYTTTPTNAVFNFQKSHYKIYRAGTNATFTIFVHRSGTNTSAQTVYYKVNNMSPYAKNGGTDNGDNDFPLQAGSDYATPDPANSTTIRDKVPDFSFPGGYTGSVGWGDKDFDSKAIEIKAYDNGLQQFNEDIQISLYSMDGDGNHFQVGMVSDCSVTIVNARDFESGNNPERQIFAPAGAVDELFNPDFGIQFWLNSEVTHPGTDGEVKGLAIQPDGNTIVVGDFYSYTDITNTYDRNCIVRVDSYGNVDATFDPGFGADDFISCVVLTTNNQIVIGGNFTSFNDSQNSSRIALLDANGGLDASFNPGDSFDGPVWGVVLQPDGKLLVGGDFNNYNGTPRNYIARLNLDGSLDATFDAGTNLNAAVLALALQPNGQIVVGGEFTNLVGVVGQSYIGRLNSNGSLDTAFDPGTGANAPVRAIGIQPDGGIVVGGDFTSINGRDLSHIARLRSNGLLDAGFNCVFGADGPVFNIVVQTNAIYSTTNYSVVVQTNFTIYVGGQFETMNGTHRLGLARLNADGSVDTTFLDMAYNQFAGLTRKYFGDPVRTVLATALQPDGQVLIGGSFDQIGGGEFNLGARPDSFEGACTNNPFVRTAIRNHSNFARLIGGATPGPGNIGLALTSYSANKSAVTKAVTLVRANGSLGNASANFSVIPGQAQSGLDYLYDGDYNGTSPLYISIWDSGRMHSDGLFGGNIVSQDDWNRVYSGLSYAQVNITITGNTNSYSDLNAAVQLSNPLNADQFYLGGEDIPLGVALGLSAAPLTIKEDRHQSGTFGFASPTYTGTGASAAIGVTRTNGTYGLVTVNCATTTNGSTAVANVDYQPIPGSGGNGQITFQDTAVNKSFTVPILVSNYNSSVELTVNLLLTGINPPSDGIASLGVTNAVLRIINPNFQGFIGLGASNYSANLTAGSVTFTVNRSVGSKGTVTNQYCTVNGSAVSGVDFVGVTNGLTWNDKDVSPKTVTIPLLNSGSVGTNRQFAIKLFNPILNGVSTPALFGPNSITNAVVTITNDNSYGTFQFSSSSYVANEDGGYSTITVIRTGATNGTATVQYATADATAFGGINYIATNNTLTFFPGQLAASFNVAIKNDGVTNPPPGSFFFTISLSNPSVGAFLGSPVVASNHIVDEVYVSPPGDNDKAFNAGSGMNGDVLALALQSSGAIIAGGSFTTVNGVPENYLARLNGNGTLDYTGFLYGLAGANSSVYALAVQTDDKILVGGAFTSMNGAVRNRITRLLTDGTQDSSFNPGAGANSAIDCLAETFVGGLRKVYIGGAFTTVNNGVSRPRIARLNDDGKPDTAFNAGTGPNGAVYAVAVYPTNSVFAGKLLVGGAFTNINGSAAGHIARLNGDGSFDASFNASLNADNAVRAIAIQNDGRVLFGGDFTNVNGVTAPHLARLNSDGSLDTSFTPSVYGGVNALTVQTDGRIIVAGQFSQANGVSRNNITRLLPNGATDATINFGDGANGAVDAVVVQPGDQMLVIGGGFTQYNDQSAGHIARIYGGAMTGSGKFMFAAGNYQVNENGAQALIGIRRVGGTSGPNADGSGNVTVNFATSAGPTNPAVAGVNYSSVNLTVNFPAGEVLQFVQVPVMQDSNITANLTVQLTLANPSSPTVLGDLANVVLTIVNVDSAVAFEKAAYPVAKDIPTGVGTLHVVRIGTSVGTCSVDYLTTTNGTAVSGTDYYPTNGTITFNPGETNKVILVPIINNGVFEGDRTVVVALSNAIGAPLYSPSNSVLTISESVQAPGNLRFSTANYVTGSGAGNAYVTVLRTNGTSGTISATFTTVPGTALPDVDYKSVSVPVQFSDGDDIPKLIAVPLVNNAIAKPAVSLSVVLTSVLSSEPGGALIDPTNATLTIVNTNNGVGFVLATNAIAEDAGTALLYVQRYGATNGTTTVNYGTTNGTAVAGVNYQAVSGTLTFYPGEVLKPVSVPVIENPLATGDLTFSVGLAQPSTGTMLVAPAVTTVLLQDVDAGFSFTNATMTVMKNAGGAVITVVCSNPRVEPVITSSNVVPLQVSYATADGTAIAGSDYQAVSGTLVFTNGIGTNTFTVPIYANGLVTGDRAFTVSLSNPTAPGQLTPPSTQTVVIAESNAGLSFSKANYTAFKNGISADIDVYRTGYTSNTASVSFIATNGTAVNGVNFVATNGILTFTNGVTRQTFSVSLIAGSVVQPNLTVALRLANPVSGVLVAPRSATLTLLENSGSYVIPAGSQVVTNYTSRAADGIIHPNDTVQVRFGFRVGAGLDVTNLVAYLLATNGVIAPSPASQTYGPLTVYGHSVSRAFTFTAQGTNAQTITPTFALYDNAKYLGTAVFGCTLGSWITTFASTNQITINDNAAASPYPSIINVSGVGGTLIKATVTLTNLTHGSSRDISALVVSPGDKNTLIMSGAGGVNNVRRATLTFDDAATNYLPYSTQIISGTNRPTIYTTPYSFP